MEVWPALKLDCKVTLWFKFSISIQDFEASEWQRHARDRTANFPASLQGLRRL
jgi:hypothetical protein